MDLNTCFRIYNFEVVQVVLMSSDLQPRNVIRSF
jgi:hypothetical protein